MKLDSINLDSENLEKILSQFKPCVSGSVDKHAPEKLSKTPCRDSWPWFNQELQGLKRSVQNREMVWFKYKQDHQWHAYKEYCNKYTTFLRSSRMMYMQNVITKIKGNSKNLYKLIAELTGSKVENPLPEDLSDEDLAEHFANFFITKIENIRNKLNNYSLYTLIENCTMGTQSEFKLLSADEIRNLVGKCK